MWLPLLLSGAQPTDPMSMPWLQYGAIGVLAAVMLWAARMFYKRLEAKSDDERQSHIAELERANQLHAAELDRFTQERERTAAAHAAEIERVTQMRLAEQLRADRMEAEVLSLNKIATEMTEKMVRAVEVVREVTDVIKYRDRG